MKTKCALFAIFLQATSLFSVNPPTPSSWSVAGPADWLLNTNWMPNVTPNAQGALAQLTNGTAVGATITFSANATVGSVSFDLGTPYTLSAGANGLIFNVASGSAQLNVTDTIGAANHLIACPVTLTSPLAVSQNSTQFITITGTISGTQSLTMNGTGVLHLQNPVVGGNTYSGGTTISSGTINVDSTTDNQLGTASVTIDTATLQFTNTAPLVSQRTYTLTGAAQINTSNLANSVTFASLAPVQISGIGSLEKIGPGTLILSVANSYSGGTTITGGQLNIANDNRLGDPSGPLVIGTATLLTTAGITSARSGSFFGPLATPSIIDTGGNTDTFTGNFSGPGVLQVQGGGIVNLTGSNSYSGGTLVRGATTLQGNTNGLQGDISLAAATSLIFNQNFDGTYAGAITSVAAGNGTLTKNGTGNVTFTGASSFSGPTNLNQGTLTVNGSLASTSSLTVAAAATLSGSGTVGPTVNSGTINPGSGSTVGALNINGTLLLNPTSNVNISLAPTSSDSIAVTGAATLDGTLTIEPTPGFYGFNVCYPIVTSSALTPGFATVTSLDSSFIPTVTYSATTATLCVEITQPFALFPFSNANTKAVGENIDALNVAGLLSADLFSVFETFIGQSFATINDALDQMHPAPYSAFTEMQTEIGGQLISLFHRMPYLPCSCSNSQRLWVEPYGNTLTLKAHGMQIGSQTNSGGIAFGYDVEAIDDFIIGLGGAWNRSELEWSHHQGRGEVNGFYGGLYSDYTIGQFYVGGSILAGIDYYDTSRHIHFLTTDRHASANYKAFDLMAQFATAYLFGSPYAFFYPYANIDYLYLHTHKFNEHGAGGLNLSVHERTDSTLRSELGLALQVQDVNKAETMCISPKISLGWVNMCPIDRPRYKSNFQDEPIPFYVEGWDQSWNLLNVDFALAFAYRCSSLRLEYNVEISPDHHTILYNQHANIRFDLRW